MGKMKKNNNKYLQPTITVVHFKVEVGLELSNEESFEQIEANDESTDLTGDDFGGGSNTQNTFGNIF